MNQGKYGNVVSSRNRAKVNNAFEQYCLWGGFPELIKFDDRIKVQVLQEYFNVMLYRDLVERYEIRDVSILKYLIKRLIGSFTKEFSINKLYNDLKSRGFSIGKDTMPPRLCALTVSVVNIDPVCTSEKYQLDIRAKPR